MFETSHINYKILFDCLIYFYLFFSLRDFVGVYTCHDERCDFSIYTLWLFVYMYAYLDPQIRQTNDPSISLRSILLQQSQSIPYILEVHVVALKTHYRPAYVLLVPHFLGPLTMWTLCTNITFSSGINKIFTLGFVYFHISFSHGKFSHKFHLFCEY